MLPIPKGWYAWLPWLAALVLTLAFLVFLQADVGHQEERWQERIHFWVEGHRTAVDGHNRDMSRQAILLARLITQDDEVMALVREAQRHFAAEQGLAAGTHTAQLRTRLREELDSYWQTLRDAGAPRLSLHFAPDDITFLRMDMPGRMGDRVGVARPIIHQVFATGEPISGADISRSGSGPSAFLPIRANVDNTGEVIAVLEVGMAALAQSDAIPGSLHMASFLQKDAIDQLLWDSVRQLLHRVNPTTVEDWRLERSEDLPVYEWWNKGQIAIEKEGQLLFDRPAADGTQKVYLASWIPVQQVGLPLAASRMAVLTWHEITPDYARYQAALHWARIKWGGALLFSLILLAGYIRFQRGYINRLLEGQRAQLSAEFQQVDAERERLALALQSSQSGFWEWDIAHDRAYFSPEWRQLCGVGPQSFHSNDLDEWMNLIHPSDKHASYTDIIRHIKGETPMYENEYRIRVRDGSYKWVQVRGKVVEWQENGRAARVLGIYSDVTERKHTELLGLRQKAALQALNEIASLSAVEPDAQLQRALQLGAGYLGLSQGVVSAIKDDNYRVRVASSPSNARIIVPHSQRLADNYCSLAVIAQDVIAEDNIPASHYRHHPAYGLTQVESYIGAPLWIKGEISGTLAFSSRQTRHHQFDSLDKDFVRLLARWISSVVERWQQDIDKKVILERFDKLNERLPGFLFQFQLRPDGTSFFPFASAGIKNIYNVEPEDVRESAEVVFSIVHEEDLGWVSEAISLSASKLTPFTGSFRINHPSRGLIWAHVESLPEQLPDGSVLWNGYGSDITSLKITEQQLTETNALRKAILDAANIAIISTDTQGIIKTFNQGAELMLGYRAEEVIDRQTPALFHVQQEHVSYSQQLTTELGYGIAPGFDSFITKAREGSTDEREWHYVRKDGTHFPVLLTVTALRDERNQVSGYLGIARDISEIKRIDKMKTEFISTVSHELRTPLTAISGALGLVVNGVVGSVAEQALKMIQIAYSNSHRLMYLVNDLLDMEKLVAGKMHFDMGIYSLRQIIQQSIEENGAYAHQYQVTYSLVGDEDVHIHVDKQRLLQVLANYLSNAAKFSPPHEVVSISIEITFGRVRVRVMDKGPGISEEFRPRLFQKFSQADASDSRQKGGTGLGLAICKEIIERMGGTLGVESSPGQGASFYFELPCDDSTQKVPASRVEPVKAKPHLLIVEDDPVTAEILSLLVSSDRYHIDAVSQGQAALELLELRNYDLMTLDLHLPDMHGTEVVRYVREHQLRQAGTDDPLPIIVISSDMTAAQDILKTSGLMERVYWLNKPLSYPEFGELLTRVLTSTDSNAAEESV